MAQTPYAELHCHSNFSFLDGASPVEDLVERAVQLGLTGLAVTDHQGLYGVVRFAVAASEAGLRPVIGIEVELVDPAAPDPGGIVIPARRPLRQGQVPATGRVAATGRAAAPAPSTITASGGSPARPRPERARLPGHRAVVKEDLRGIGERQRGPHLVLLARDAAGYRSLCRLVSRANLAGTKRVPRFTQALLADHAEGVVALSGCREGEIARRLRVGDRAGANAVARRYAAMFASNAGARRQGARGTAGDGPATSGFFLELSHHLLPDDDWLVAETAALAADLGLPVVTTNDVHHARPEDRELGDVLTAIAHGRTLDTLGDLRRRDAQSHLKSGGELLAMPPGEAAFARADPATARAWAEGIATSAEIAASCTVDLGFERYRFPGFPVPAGETAFSYLVELCQAGVRRRYHPVSPAVVRQLAHELDVVEKTGLAEFFLICWDLMRFAKERGIPAQGRGSAADSIVAYALGITRVDPIRHNLLFERFINEGRTTYPDVDIDFSSARREEVIQYVYGRYGPEHTGMVCNLVTYRARSAVREVGYALGFPRPLVDRVAKALETYDSVMVRRDLEADGGFAEFFRRPGEGVGAGAGAAVAGDAALGSAARVGERGFTDRMGQLNVRRGRGPVAAGVGPGAAGVGPGAAESSPMLTPRALGGIGRPDDARDGPPEPEIIPARAWPGTKLLGVPAAAPAGGTELSSKDRPPSIGQEPARPGLRFAAESPAPGSGTWTMAAGSKPAIRAGGSSDDEGGPGDSPASVAWLRAGRGTGHEAGPGSWREAGPGTVDGRPIDPESGAVAPPGRRTDRLGRPYPWDPPAILGPMASRGSASDRGGRVADTGAGSSVARVEPEPPPQPRGGSTIGLSDWERWLELCARIDGFPRHLSIHSGGMLVTAAPLIDIAPLERATMADRVVVQFDKRDVETLKLIKLDLLGLGMLAAIDETLGLIETDCATCIDLDAIPEEIPEVFAMLQAADTVGVFQVESRAQMQTLPKSRPRTLDDLVVEVAIIRPGPIQGNAVHPYLRRKQGLEPVTYLHPSLEPILAETMGVILYQEQVMKVAIEVAGFTPAGSDGFRRAMGTWRSTREMEKLHLQFIDGCLRQPGMTGETAEELFRQVAAFASFGFAKSHAAAFARTAYESSFLKLFYPAQFLVGLINAQPMGFYPVEVLVNDAKRHGVAILPVDINASSYRTVTEWAGRPGWALAGAAGDDGSHDADPGEPIPEGAGIGARPRPVRSSACFNPTAAARDRWAAESAVGWGVRLGLHLVKGIGEQHAEFLDRELDHGPYASLADVVERTGLPEETIERLIRTGALDSLGRPRRELLWQLREVAGASRGRLDGRTLRGAGRGRGRGSAKGDPARRERSERSLDLRLPATDAPALPPITEPERVGDAYAVVGLDARRQVVSLFRPALDRLGAVTNASLADRRPGPVRIGGLVVTRQHPMTAKGTVFLALEDETGMVNVTLWPDAWERLRSIVRRHALLLVDGELQRESSVVNVVARSVRPLPEVATAAGGPERPDGVRQLGHAGMRRLA
ncbi:MAG TPA: PHP domain-containing protein [Candidatus Sulfomarinibacteraceae bacterium]|nr:PHP domain-containing protein [Candidatus Sulfomarinibacteraceae bacterium]